MFSTALPLSILVSAPLLSHANPIFGFGGGGTVVSPPAGGAATSSVSADTGTFRILPVSDHDATAGFSGIVTSNVASSATSSGTGTSTDAANAVGCLNRLAATLTTATNGVQTALNNIGALVNYIGVTDQSGQASFQLFGSHRPSIQIRNAISGTINTADSLTSQISAITVVLNNTPNAFSPADGNAVYNSVADIPAKMDTFVTQVTSLVDTCRSSGQPSDLSQLGQSLKRLQTSGATAFPHLASQCGSAVQSQSLASSWAWSNSLLGICINLCS
ncbi:hypothetical protein B0H10DRAFT_1942858 [Mycena sp. CBHHK59/15]|nr:hypothetical protein B0H10DRAFT_1942858 [Mycena sp. CBHHK59/15]